MKKIYNPTEQKKKEKPEIFIVFENHLRLKKDAQYAYFKIICNEINAMMICVKTKQEKASSNVK